MNKDLRIGRKLLCLVIAIVMIMTLIPRLPASFAYAAAGDVPAHSKTLTPNNDGTYKLALNIKGESEKIVNKVNVLVIFDVSSSMNSGVAGGGTRLSAAKNAVNNLANTLLSLNGQGDNPSNAVQMAMVTFGNTATTRIAPTTSASTYTNSVSNITIPTGVGTNWEAAMQQANTVNFGDDDQTFIIFVSDGNPTFRYTEGNYPNHNNDYNADYYRQYGVWGSGSDSGQGSGTTIARCYEHAVDDAQTLANKTTVTPNRFYTIGAYGNVDRMQDLTEAVGAPDGNYFSASNTTELQQALASILEDIQTAGIGAASIKDPTTQDVVVSSDVTANLLKVDDSSFQYYRNGVVWPDAPPATLDADGNVLWDLSSVGILENGVTYTVDFDVWPTQETYDMIADLENGDLDYDEDVPDAIKEYLIKDGDSYTLRTNKDFPSITYTDTRTEDGPQTVNYTNPDPVATAVEKMDITKVWINDIDWRGQEQYASGFAMDVLRDGTKCDEVTVKPEDWSDEIYISTGLMRVHRDADENITSIEVLDEGHDYTLKEPDNMTYYWELVIETLHPMLVNGELHSFVQVKDEDIPEGMGTADFYTLEGVDFYRIGGKVFEDNGPNENDTASVSAYNERKSNLNIKKTITGNSDIAPEGTKFDYTISVTDVNGDDVWFAVQDAEGGYISAEDLAVTGATAEEGDTGYFYAPSGGTISLKLQEGWNLRFINLPTYSTYTVEEGSTMDPGFTFDNVDGTTEFEVSGLPNGAVDLGNDQFSYDGVIYTKVSDTKYTAVYEPTVTDMKVEGKIVSPNAPYQITYANKYTPTKVTPKVTKAVTGWDATEAFTFSIEAADDATKAAVTAGDIVLPESTTVTTGEGMKDGDTKEVSFGDITFNRTGTYTFTIKETNASAPAGWTYANAAADAKTLTVEVTSGEDGLVATVTGDNPTFTNSYEAEPTEAQIPVLKNATPDEGLDVPDIEGKFTFTLAPVNGAPMPADGTTTVVCGPSGTPVSFPAIEYAEVGTYQYQITESVTPGQDAGGVELETTSPKTISVVVSDDGSGELIAVVNGGSPLQFNNPYHVSSLPLTIPVEKILEVPEGLNAPDITGEFTFTIATTNGAPLPETKTLTNPSATGGNMTFGDKESTGEIVVSSPGTYIYTITESGSVPGVENDEEATQTVTVTVTDKGDGTLEAEYSIEKASFTNTYSVEPTTASIPVEKILDAAEGLNAPDITGEFTFTLTAGEGTPMPEVTSYTNPDADGGDMTFGTISFEKPGTFTYTVTETGEVDGVSAVGPTSKTVTISVVDNRNGTLTATVGDGSGDPLQFTNEYKVGEATAEIPVNKILDAADGLDPDSIANKFTFTLSAEEGTPMPQTTSFTNPSADGGKVTFGGVNDPITYTEPGTYTYTVTETGSAPGVTNDPVSSKTVDVVVTDNGDGTMTAVVNDGEELDFTNTYNVEPTTVSFPAKKELNLPEGTTGPDITEKYTIKLTAAEGTPMPAVTEYKNPDSNGGTVTFGEISYTEPGTYTYTVSEEGTVPGVTNDSAASGKTVTVTVEDNGDGTLTAAASSTADNPVTFTNSYSYGTITATPAVHKVLEYEDGLTPPDITEKYTFTLTGKNGAPMPAEGGESVKNPARDGGTTNFGTITFSAPGTYSYEVTETGTVAGVKNDTVSPKTFTITVTDNKDGTLSAVIDYGNDEGHVTFTNTYEVGETTAEFPVEKIMDIPQGLTGPANWSYTINVAAQNGAPEAETMSGTVTKAAPSTEFGPFTYTAPGTYTYTVSETGQIAGVTNDAQAAGKTVTVEVVDNGDGTLTATASSTEEEPLQFTNTYNVEETTAEFPVEKIMTVPKGLDGPETWSYTINVAAQNGAPEAETMSGTVTKAAPSTEFGPFTYTTAGTYTYTVSEVGTVAGVTNDAQAAGKTVTVEVVDNGDGTLTATASSTDEKPLTFTNAYDVEETTLSFPVEKIMTVPEGLDGPADWSYTINVAAQNGAPEAETMEGTVTKAAPSTEFGPFTYTAPGTYTYTVSETGQIAGVTNDAQAAGKTVTVEVVDNGDGTLTATASSTEEEPLQFTNTYSVEDTTVSFPVKKDMVVPEELDGPETWSYEIKVEAQDGAPAAETMTGTVTNDADTVTFGEFTYSLPGTYTYTVSETGQIAGVTNDTQAVGKTVTVTVVDNGDGTLTATADSTADEPLTFTNTYSVEKVIVDPPVKKILENADLKDHEGEFTFKIEGVSAPEGVDEIPMPTNTEITNIAKYLKDGSTDLYEFGEIEYLVPGVYTYTISEVGGDLDYIEYDGSEYTLTVTVTDNRDGTLSAVMDPEEGEMVFNNVYTAEGSFTLDVKKILKGADLKDGQFTFELKGPEGKLPETVSVKNKADGTVTFGPVAIDQSDVGKTFEYTITEVNDKQENVTYDTKTITAKVTISDNHDGTLSVKTEYTDKATFTNTYEEPPAKTGDTTPIVEYTVILSAALVLLLMVLIRKRRAN